VLGIFGRYRRFRGRELGISANDTAELDAFRAFRNFDGAGATFGDQGLAVTGTLASQNSAYAALDSKDPKRLTLVVINKSGSSQPTFESRAASSPRGHRKGVHGYGGKPRARCGFAGEGERRGRHVHTRLRLA